MHLSTYMTVLTCNNHISTCFSGNILSDSFHRQCLCEQIYLQCLTDHFYQMYGLCVQLQRAHILFNHCHQAYHVCYDQFDRVHLYASFFININVTKHVLFLSVSQSSLFFTSCTVFIFFISFTESIPFGQCHGVHPSFTVLQRMCPVSSSFWTNVTYYIPFAELYHTYAT